MSNPFTPKPETKKRKASTVPSTIAQVLTKALTPKKPADVKVPNAPKENWVGRVKERVTATKQKPGPTPGEMFLAGTKTPVPPKAESPAKPRYTFPTPAEIEIERAKDMERAGYSRPGLRDPQQTYTAKRRRQVDTEEHGMSKLDALLPGLDPASRFRAKQFMVAELGGAELGELRHIDGRILNGSGTKYKDAEDVARRFAQLYKSGKGQEIEGAIKSFVDKRRKQEELRGKMAGLQFSIRKSVIDANPYAATYLSDKDREELAQLPIGDKVDLNSAVWSKISENAKNTVNRALGVPGIRAAEESYKRMANDPTMTPIERGVAGIGAFGSMVAGLGLSQVGDLAGMAADIPGEVINVAETERDDPRKYGAIANLLGKAGAVAASAAGAGQGVKLAMQPAATLSGKAANVVRGIARVGYELGAGGPVPENLKSAGEKLADAVRAGDLNPEELRSVAEEVSQALPLDKARVKDFAAKIRKGAIEGGSNIDDIDAEAAATIVVAMEAKTKTKALDSVEIRGQRSFTESPKKVPAAPTRKPWGERVLYRGENTTGKPRGQSLGEGVYLTEHKPLAESYGAQGAVSEYKIRPDAKILESDSPEYNEIYRLAWDTDESSVDRNRLVAIAKERGYQGVAEVDSKGNAAQIVVFDSALLEKIPAPEATTPAAPKAQKGEAPANFEGRETVTLYHGSTTPGFSKFDPEKTFRGKMGPTQGQGIYLTASPEEASKFSKPVVGPHGGGVYKVEVTGKFLRLSDEIDAETYLALVGRKGDPGTWDDAVYDAERYLVNNGMEPNAAGKAVAEKLRKMGYDGLIENTEGTDNYIVWDPSVIKNKLTGKQMGDTPPKTPDLGKLTDDAPAESKTPDPVAKPETGKAPADTSWIVSDAERKLARQTQSTDARKARAAKQSLAHSKKAREVHGFGAGDNVRLVYPWGAAYEGKLSVDASGQWRVGISNATLADAKITALPETSAKPDQIPGAGKMAESAPETKPQGTAQELIDEVDRRIAAGQEVYFSTQLQVTKLSKPGLLKANENGEIMVARGKKWDTLAERQENQLREQVGVPASEEWRAERQARTKESAERYVKARAEQVAEQEREQEAALARSAEKAREILESGVNPETGKPLTASLRRDLQKVSDLSPAPANAPRETPGIVVTEAGGRALPDYARDGTKKYSMEWRVMSLDDVVQSHDPQSFGPNPRFPVAEDLQPRDRTRTESRVNVQKMAQTLDADLLLDDTKALTDGSPIVDSRGIVEHGNGRTMAVKLAQLEHPDKYEAYVAELRQRFPEAAEIENPVLVRVRTSELDPAEQKSYSRIGSTPTGQGMSTTETALADAQSLDDSFWGNLEIIGDNFEDTITAAANRGKITSFLAKIPESERAEFLDASGHLSEAGVTRIRNAAVFSLLGEDGNRFAAKAMESGEMSRRVYNGLVAALPSLLKYKTPNLVRTLNDGLTAWQEFVTSPFKTVDDYLAQQTMAPLTPRAKYVLEKLGVAAGPRGSGKQVAAEFNAMAELNRSIKESQAQDSMFGADEVEDLNEFRLFSRKPVNAMEEAELERWIKYVKNWGDDASEGLRQFNVDEDAIRVITAKAGVPYKPAPAKDINTGLFGEPDVQLDLGLFHKRYAPTRSAGSSGTVTSGTYDWLPEQRRGIVTFYETAQIDTAVHELMHHFGMYMEDKYFSAISKALGIEDKPMSEFTPEEYEDWQEFWARGVEDALFEGTVQGAQPEVQAAFDHAAQKIRKVYGEAGVPIPSSARGLNPTSDMTPVHEVFAQMLSGELKPKRTPPVGMPVTPGAPSSYADGVYRQLRQENPVRGDGDLAPRRVILFDGETYELTTVGEQRAYDEVTDAGRKNIRELNKKWVAARTPDEKARIMTALSIAREDLHRDQEDFFYNWKRQQRVSQGIEEDLDARFKAMSEEPGTPARPTAPKQPAAPKGGAPELNAEAGEVPFKDRVYKFNSPSAKAIYDRIVNESQARIRGLQKQLQEASDAKSKKRLSAEIQDAYKDRELALWTFFHKGQKDPGISGYKDFVDQMFIPPDSVKGAPPSKGVAVQPKPEIPEEPTLPPATVAPDGKLSTSHLKTGFSEEPMKLSMSEKIKAIFFDDAIRAVTARKALEKSLAADMQKGSFKTLMGTAADISEAINKQARLGHKIEDYVKRGIRNDDGQRLSRGVLQIRDMVEASGIDLEKWQWYKRALRENEIYDQGRGGVVDRKRAEVNSKYVTEFLKSLTDDQTRALAEIDDQWRQLADAHLQLFERYGLKPEGWADEIRQENLHYFPLFSAKDSIEATMQGLNPQKLASPGVTVQRATGGTVYIDGFAAMAREIERVVRIGEATQAYLPFFKTAAAQAKAEMTKYLEAVKGNPNDPHLKKPELIKWVEDITPPSSEEKGMRTAAWGGSADLDPLPEEFIEGVDPILKLTENGEQRVYRVDPYLWAAIRGAMPAEENLAASAFQAVAKVARAGTTGALNPQFQLIFNPIIDFTSAMVTQGIGPAGWAKAFYNTVLRGASFGPKELYDEAALSGVFTNSKGVMDYVPDEWLFDPTKKNQVQKAIEKASQARGIKLLSNGYEFLQYMGQTMEETTKLAAYEARQVENARKVARTQGRRLKDLSQAEVAAIRAENKGTAAMHAVSTMNFARSGQLGKFFARAGIPYAGIPYQVMLAHAKAIQRDPVKYMMRATALIGGPAAIEYALYHDDSEWKEMPAYLRHGAVLFRDGIFEGKPHEGDWIGIRIPEELGIIIRGGIFATMEKESALETGGMMAKEELEKFVPSMPTAIALLGQEVFNRNGGGVIDLRFYDLRAYPLPSGASDKARDKNQYKHLVQQMDTLFGSQGRMVTQVGGYLAGKQEKAPSLLQRFRPRPGKPKYEDVTTGDVRTTADIIKQIESKKPRTVADIIKGIKRQ